MMFESTINCIMFSQVLENNKTLQQKLSVLQNEFNSQRILRVVLRENEVRKDGVKDVDKDIDGDDTEYEDIVKKEDEIVWKARKKRRSGNIDTKVRVKETKKL